MPDLVKDFIGLNILVNDPQGDDSKDSSNDTTQTGVDVNNTVGFDTSATGYSIDAALQEQQILPILLTHRNGNYGYSSWKQIRNSHKSVVRNERKYNKLSTVSDPVPKQVTVGNRVETIMFRDLIVRSYNEPCVVSKHHPVVVLLTREEFDDQNKRAEFLYALEASYNNEITFMTNGEVNVHAGLIPIESEDYNALKGLYLKGALEDEESPFKGFRSFIFKQTVFPPEEFTFKSYTKKRVNFVSGYWRDLRVNRVINKKDFSNSYRLEESIWPLDAPNDFTTRIINSYPSYNNAGLPTQYVGKGAGALQNYHAQINIESSHLTRPKSFIPSYSYNRRSIFNPKSSDFFIDLSSSRDTITGSFGSNFDIMGRVIAADSGCQAAKQLVQETKDTGWSWFGFYGGEAFWDAPVMAGREPFDDNIDEFYEIIEKKYKDYSIIPEYKINSHIDFYLENGIKKQNLDLFEITGGVEGVEKSGNPDFYRVYSNSDFFQNFKMIKKDHKDFTDPSAISLTCKAVKKLIPYQGFYPAQRTSNIAEQFYESYKGTVIPEQDAIFDSNSYLDGYFRYLQKPLFGPGILFNTIKSGLAVSFPIYTIPTTDTRIATGSITLTGISTHQSSKLFKIFGESNGEIGDYYNKLPFESLLEPEKNLAGFEIYYPELKTFTNYRTPSKSDLSSSVFWSGQGDSKYRKMINNFLAETPEFFLENKNFTKLRSKKQSDPNFGFMKSGFTYRMRLKTFKTFKTKKQPIKWDNTGSVEKFVEVPQSLNDFGITAAEESITMYSRPSAFGPEEGALYADLLTSHSPVYFNYWQTTPPYYHGECWTDISFTPTESKKFSIDEIVSGSVIEHKRYFNPRIVNPVAATGWLNTLQKSLDFSRIVENNINSIAMNNDSSFNIFVKERAFESETPSSNPNTEDYLVIQSKFETPIINFNNVQTSSMTLGNLNNGKTATPIGMWHQFGQIPNQDEGIFTQITDVPISYLHADNIRNKAAAGDTGFQLGSQDFDWDTSESDEFKDLKSKNKSLADVLGFTKTPVRLGEIARVKKIKEAVVAVPFFDDNGAKNFFPIPRKDIDNAIKGNTKLCGQSVIEMIDRMKQYNFPPPMDFLTYREVDPFAMYIFEFEHDLSQQDLSYIWQNLAPDIALTHDTAEATITHELLAHELLGGGAVITTTEDGAILNESSKGELFNEKIRWMVFKVKYKAKTNYFDKMAGKSDSIPQSKGIGPRGQKDLITYNWPYDFFSLVELVKIDASVEFSNIERDEKTKERVVKDFKPEPTTSKQREALNPRKIIKKK